MKFQPERLILLRNALGICKAEAARRLNMSAMGYGRYESGEREPSFQMVSFIAQILDTTTDYLYGETDNAHANTITISSAKDPELFALVQSYQSDNETAQRLLKYLEKLNTPK